MVDRAVGQPCYLDFIRDQNAAAAQMQAVLTSNVPVPVSAQCTLSTTPSILIPVVCVAGTAIQAPLLHTQPNFDQAAPPRSDSIQREVVEISPDPDQEQDETPEWCRTLDSAIPITMSTICPKDLWRAKQRTNQAAQSSTSIQTTNLLFAPPNDKQLLLRSNQPEMNNSTHSLSVIQNIR